MHRALYPILAALLAATPLVAQHPAAAHADTTVLFEAYTPGTPTPGAAHLPATPENAAVMHDSTGTWLRTTDGTTFVVTLPRALPDTFQVEATLWAGQATPINAEFGSAATWRCGMSGVSIVSAEVNAQQDFPNAENRSPGPVHCRLVVNGRNVEGWIGDARLITASGAAFGHGREIEIRVPGGEQPSHFSSLRVFTVHAPAAAPAGI